MIHGISSIYIERARTKSFYFDRIFAGVLLKTGDLLFKYLSNLLQRVVRKKASIKFVAACY